MRARAETVWRAGGSEGENVPGRASVENVPGGVSALRDANGVIGDNSPKVGENCVFWGIIGES